MHFGPEWMRTKQHPTTKTHNPSSPPSTYSSLVSPILFEKRDDPNPFRYSKDEMLGIYKEGNVKIQLALEVERWDGVVREVPSDPVGLREMDEVEKKVDNSCRHMHYPFAHRMPALFRFSQL
jgi:PERQ amino acid-rich with GYF domain-containing protein